MAVDADGDIVGLQRRLSRLGQFGNCELCGHGWVSRAWWQPPVGYSIIDDLFSFMSIGMGLFGRLCDHAGETN